MASLVLGTVGQAVGPSLFGAGFSAFGISITGAQIGGAIGALAGSLIDSALMPGQHIVRQGPRLSDINVQSSTEGAPIPRVFGRIRVAGQLIWASKFKETATTTNTGGGKGFGSSVKVTETDYTYSISFAVGLCAGVTTKIGRVWADGKLVDLSQFITRFYKGDETQTFDPLIENIEGEGNTPAYRGLSYIVFEDMPLAQFGNRIPQLQFEIVRSISTDKPDALENRLTGVTLIPGAGEFIYADEIVMSNDGEGTTTPENAHNSDGESDLSSSLDELQAIAPNIGAVSLVCGWFGNDLRCGECEIKPGVEETDKNTYPETWEVNGIAREDAHVISRVDNRPAYGGTPSDQTIVAAIRNLKARGLRVMFNPFLFMDIAEGNTLPDPVTGETGQPLYPWRGRITSAADKTSAAATDIDAFFNGEWGYRRMVLHYAQLCKEAGGVNAFLIGSELRGLTRLRDSATTYPAVAALKTLAADVRAILGPSTKIGYAADWSEYNNHQTGDAPGAVQFNLDPLWSDANIDFIGIDNYLPLADWRDGTAHADYDAANGPTDTHDPAYLAANIQGGEDYDWYYASDADRNAQLRTPITDGLGKPWFYRQKDFWNWWSNPHYDRADGSESASATDWVPQSKPIWFCELGCPAVEKGANQPNVFVDAKSSESAVPYYSNGERDDLIQRRFLEAHLKFWNTSANNPASGEYAGRMIDTSNLYLWTWDARPFPFFPSRSDVWGDAENYRLGHWLNGRLGAVQLSDLVTELCTDAGFADCDVSGLSGLVTGYAVTDTMSPRDALAPLGLAYGFDAVESEGKIKFVMRGRPTTSEISQNDLVLPEGAVTSGFNFTRAQETDLPNASRIAYIDASADYRQAIAESRRLVTLSDRVATSNLPLVLDQGEAIGIGARLLQDAWMMRETGRFALPPSQLALDPADEIVLSANGRNHRVRIASIDDAGARNLETVATDPSIYESISGPSRALGAIQSVAYTGRAVVAFMDLPLLTGNEIAWAPTAAAFASPWPGQVVILKSATEANYTLDTALTRAAIIGVTTADFYSGPTSRWDQTNTLRIRLFNGALSSKDDLTVFGGANALALENQDGEWEILQFANADLTAPKQWSLTKLLRGQAGTESAMRNPVPAGARVVLLDGAQKQLALTLDQYNLPFNYLWGPQGKPISDPAFQGATKQFTGAGLRPYAPCQLRAAYSGDDIALSWIRRDRSPGSDGWEQTEIPMSESSERYDVEILDAAGDVVRTVSAIATPALTYTASDIATDFPGGLPSPFRFNVYQLSTTVGRGSRATAAIFI
ncbi:MAG TPA: glycoside hydrolase/phage tail family protein [Rhizomicrobium sp.]|nr:glycoside hydrolase/phage tail family protein [Rhizomicrobium sp.]